MGQPTRPMSQRGTPRMTPRMTPYPPSMRGTPRSKRGTPRGRGGTPFLPAVSQRSSRSAPAQATYPMPCMPPEINFQHASPGLGSYQCLVQKSGKMAHPGLVLPPRFQSTQGLFSPGANGFVAGRIPVGSCSSLQSISGEVPASAPRFLTHDCASCSVSVYSNFRKTAINFIQCTDPIQSEHNSSFKHPTVLEQESRRVPKYRFGSPNEIYGCSEMASMSGSG